MECNTQHLIEISSKFFLTDDICFLRLCLARTKWTVSVSLSRRVLDRINQVTSIVDPLSGAMTNVYDELDRLYYTRDPLGGTTFLQYNTQHDVTRIATQATFSNFLDYALFHEVVYNPAADPQHDPAAQILQRPEQAITQFAYNTFGDVTNMTDTYGVTHTFSYDANGKHSD